MAENVERRSRLRRLGSTVSDGVRTQLWPIPAIAVVLAVVLGVVLPRVDSSLRNDLPFWVADYLFSGGAGAARTVLDAIASSLITVTSLTFSLTVVTLQLASSQFSPRLLRTFSSDRTVQVTLALFLATFTYALTVERTVRTDTSSQASFVPQFSVTFAFVLTVVSVLSLVAFLAHLARQIRVETMLRDVHREASATLTRVLEPLPPALVEAPEPPADALPLMVRSSGFLVRTDEAALLDAATATGTMLLLQRHPGSSLVAGTPVGVAWRLGGGPVPEEERDELLRRVAQALTVGYERTAAQDVGFGVKQLTDVATKALSPGINDPTTAITAIGHASALLCELAARDLGPRLLRDEQDRVRVAMLRPDLGALLDLAVSQPRRYGSSDAAVAARLFVLLREVAWVAGHHGQECVAHQLERLRGSVAKQDLDDAERADLEERAQRVEDALGGRWTGEQDPA